MKRFHVRVAVDDLKRSIGFYSAPFTAEPSVLEADCAKWTLDDPRINFAVSTRRRQVGLGPLGIRAESGDELKEIYARRYEAGGRVVEQGDPAGISWETFHTIGESIDYGDGSGERVARVAREKSCCASAAQVAEACDRQT